MPRVDIVFTGNSASAVKAANDVSQSLKNIEQSTQSVSSALQSTGSIGQSVFASIAQSAAGVAIGGLIQQSIATISNSFYDLAISVNKNLELTTLQFTTFMGDADMAASHVQNLYAIAANTPFEMAPLAAMSKQLENAGGAFLNNIETITLLGDAVAATGADMGRLTFWYDRFFSQLSRGQPLTEAINGMSELGVMTPALASEIQQLVDSGAGFEEVWNRLNEGLGRFSGAMESQSQTLDGYQSTISDMVKKLGGISFMPVFELFKGAMAKLAGFLSDPALEEAATSVSDVLRVAFEYGVSAAEWFADGISAIVSYVSEVMSSLADTIAYWLQPHSPPKVAPNIDQWGQSTAQLYMDSWGDANFDSFDTLSSLIETNLRNLVDMGEMSKGNLIENILGSRNTIALITEEMERTGKISEELLSQLLSNAGESADELRDVIKAYEEQANAAKEAENAQIRLDKASQGVADAESELQDAIENKNNLSDEEQIKAVQLARKKVEDAKKEEDLAKKAMALAKERVDLAVKASDAAKNRLKILEDENALIKEQKDLLASMGGGGGGGGGDSEAKKAEREKKALEEAERRYNTELMTTEERLAAARAELEQMNPNTAEYYNKKLEVKRLEEEFNGQQEAAQKKREEDLKKEEEAVKKVEDAEWDYNFSLQDKNGKIDMLREKLKGLNPDSVEYYKVLGDIARLEAEVAKETEKKGSAAKKAGGESKNAAQGLIDAANKAREAQAKLSQQVDNTKNRIVMLHLKTGRFINDVQSFGVKLIKAFLDPVATAGRLSLTINTLSRNIRKFLDFKVDNQSLTLFFDRLEMSIRRFIRNTIGTATNTSGFISKLVSSWFMAGNMVAKSFIDGLRYIYIGLKPVFQFMYAKLRDSFSPANLAAAGVSFSAFLSSQIDSFSLFFSNLASNIGLWIQQYGPSIMESVKGIASAVISWIPNAESALVTFLLNLATTIANNITTILPSIVNAILPLAQSFLSWYPTAQGEFYMKVSSLLTGIGDIVIAALPAIVTALAALIGPITEWVITALPTLANNLGAFLSSITSWITTNVPVLMDMLKSWANAFIDWITALLPSLGTNLGLFLGAITGWVVEMLPDLVISLATIAAKFIEWLTLDVLPRIPGLLEQLATAFYNFIAGFVIALAPHIQSLVTKMTAWITDEAIPKTKTFLDQLGNSIIQWITDNVLSLYNKAKELGSAIGNGISDAVGGALGGLYGMAKNAINPVIDSINKLIDGINSVSGAVGLGTIGRLPKLATGTNFFSGGLALVGERGPELVYLPRASKVSPTNARDTQTVLGTITPTPNVLNQQPAQATTVNMTVNLPNSIGRDDRDFVRRIVDELQKELAKARKS